LKIRNRKGIIVLIFKRLFCYRVYISCIRSKRIIYRIRNRVKMLRIPKIKEIMLRKYIWIKFLINRI